MILFSSLFTFVRNNIILHNCDIHSEETLIHVNNAGFEMKYDGDNGYGGGCCGCGG